MKSVTSFSYELSKAFDQDPQSLTTAERRYHLFGSLKGSFQMGEDMAGFLIKYSGHLEVLYRDLVASGYENVAEALKESALKVFGTMSPTAERVESVAQCLFRPTLSGSRPEYSEETARKGGSAVFDWLHERFRGLDASIYRMLRDTIAYGRDQGWYKDDRDLVEYWTRKAAEREK